MSKLHGFLYRHFRVSERHRSPRCVSMEVERGGTFEGALKAEEWRVWALLVMKRAAALPGWTAEHERTLAAYYLNMAIEHVPILESDVQGLLFDEGTIDEVQLGGDDVVTLGTIVSWPQMAKVVTGKDSPARRARVQKLFAEGVGMVWEAMQAMEERAATVGLIQATHMTPTGTDHKVHRFGRDAHHGHLRAYEAACGAYCPDGHTRLGTEADITCTACKGE